MGRSCGAGTEPVQYSPAWSCPPAAARNRARHQGVTAGAGTTGPAADPVTGTRGRTRPCRYHAPHPTAPRRHPAPPPGAIPVDRVPVDRTRTDLLGSARVIITHMDKELLGRRVARAREDVGMTQDVLGRAVELDRSAISRLEKGERKINVPELVRIAAALDRPLAYFVADPVPAVVSRRTDIAHAHATTRQLDDELELFAADVRGLVALRALPIPDRSARRLPADHDAAERAASSIRDQLDLGTGPIDDLGRTCEDLGMYTFAAPLVDGSVDGGCVEVEWKTGVVGAAVINGSTPPGRRRMTLAHELGHWLFGDAYDAESSSDNERMINSFAIHLLAPRSGVIAAWNKNPTGAARDRALAVGAAFRLSWTAVLSQLRNLGLIDEKHYNDLAGHRPTRGDYLRTGLTWKEELAAPYVGPSFTAAVLNAYTEQRLTGARSLELLRGTLSADQLPTPVAVSTEDLRRAFYGHDD